MEVRRTLDLHGAEARCGDPAVVVVRRALQGLGVGEHLEVFTDVAEHAFIVREIAAQDGRSVVSASSDGREQRLVVG